MRIYINFLNLKKSNRCRIIASHFILIILNIHSIYAQHKLRNSDVSSFHIQQYNNENGLPQNSVKDIASDKDGFVWLVTEAGLVRFDGRNFKSWDSFQLGLKQNIFYRFQKKLSGPQSELTAVIGRTEFVTMDKGQTFRDSSYSSKVLAWLPDLDNVNNTFIASGLPNGSEYTLSPKRYVIPLSDSGQTFAVVKSNQIEYYQNWQKKSVVHTSKSSIWRMFPIGSMLFTKSETGSFSVIDPSGKTPGKLIGILGDINKDPLFQSSKSHLKMFWNTGSDQVFFYLADRLYRVSKTEDNNLSTKLILSGFDLTKPEIIRIYHDALQERILLASQTDGLFILSKKKFRSILPDTEGVSASVYAQTQHSESSVLLASGLEVNLDIGSGKNPVVLHEQLAKLKLYDRVIMTDSSGAIWVRFHETIYQFSSDAKRVLNSWHVPGEAEAFLQAPSGAIWIGTRQGNVFSVDPSNPKREPKLLINGLPCIRNIVTGSSFIWISTDDGVYRTSTEATPADLIIKTKGLKVRSIHVSDRNEVWFTAQEKGLFLLFDDKLILFPPDEKKALTTAHCIIDDSNGFFWIPTNNGLFQVQINDLRRYAADRKANPYYHMYKSKDGFINNEFNGGCQPCSSGIINGTLSIPSLHGLVTFRPSQIRAEVPSAGIFIDRLMINGTASGRPADTMYLESSSVLVEIDVTSPYFSNEENLIFEYTMQDPSLKQASWHLVGSDNRISLTDITSGSQTITVRKRTGFNTGTFNFRSITFVVEKPWYHTWTFRGLAFAGLLMMFWAYGSIKSRTLKRRNTALENAVAKRTAINQQTIKALQESENRMSRQTKIQSRLIASLTHDIQSPLQAVITVSKGIEKLIDKGDIQQAAELNEVITTSIAGISKVMQNTLDYLKLDIRGDTLSAHGFNLHELVAEKVELFSLATVKKQNTIVNLVPKNIILKTNPYLLGIVISNLIDNANKHTRNGEITISNTQDEAQLELKISDNGIGIPSNIINWINTKIDSGQEYKSIDSINGVGLILTKEFVRILNGEIKANNSEKGCTFTIFIPI